MKELTRQYAFRAGQPRRVPIRARLAILFGGPMQVFGWFWLMLSSVVLWHVPSRLDFEFWRFYAATAQAAGAVDSRTVVSRPDDRPPVRRVHYTFVDAEGRRRTGVSYVDDWRPTKPGSPVTVEYLPGNPGVSRLVDGRSNELPLWSAVFLVFPLIGVLLVRHGLRSGARQVRLLPHGVLADATILSVEKSALKSDEQPTFTTSYRFQANGREFESKVVVSETDGPPGDTVPVLFDPQDPANHMALISLNAGATIRPDGTIVPPTMLATVGILTPPLLVMLVNLLLLADALGVLTVFERT